MSIKIITHSNRRIALVVVATLVLLVAAALLTVSRAQAGNAEDPCTQPVAERVGGWICPTR